MVLFGDKLGWPMRRHGTTELAALLLSVPKQTHNHRLVKRQRDARADFDVFDKLRPPHRIRAKGPVQG